MGNEYALISKEDLGQMINTLKGLDVRGYESMNHLVATVVFLENLLIQSNNKPQAVASVVVKKEAESEEFPEEEG